MVSFKESISAEELDKLELASFPGKIFVVDTVGAEFNRAVNYLRSQKIIGFDTETRPCFSPDQPRYGVALLQLSGPERAYLFRIKSLGMHRRLRNLPAHQLTALADVLLARAIRSRRRARERPRPQTLHPLAATPPCESRRLATPCRGGVYFSLRRTGATVAGIAKW